MPARPPARPEVVQHARAPRQTLAAVIHGPRGWFARVFRRAWVREGKAFEEFPQAGRFTDFRNMFDAVKNDIDGVVISTPDHTHVHPAWWASERGMPTPLTAGP